MKTIQLLGLAIGAAGILITAPPSHATAETDQAINDKIFKLLLNDRSLAKGSEKVTATTHDGQVILVGDTTTETKKDQLHKAIAGVPGVHQVNDKQLIPRPTAHDVGPEERPLGPNL